MLAERSLRVHRLCGCQCAAVLWASPLTPCPPWLPCRVVKSLARTVFYQTKVQLFGPDAGAYTSEARD